MQHEPETEMLINKRKKRFKKKNRQVVEIMTARKRRDQNGDKIDDDGPLEILNSDQKNDLREVDFKQKKHASAARQGSRRRLNNVINLIAQINSIHVPISQPQ